MKNIEKSNYLRLIIISLLNIGLFLVFSISQALGSTFQVFGESSQENIIQKHIPDLKKIEVLCNEVNLEPIPYTIIKNDTLLENSYGKSNSVFFIGANKLTIKFAVCATNEEALIKMAEKIYHNQKKGLQIETGIADEAISLTYKNELLQLRENHLIFRKQNVVVEIQAMIYNWSNEDFPCFNPNNLKLLAHEINTLSKSLPNLGVN